MSQSPNPFSFAVGQDVTLAAIPKDGSRPAERISGRLIAVEQRQGLLAIRQDGLKILKLVSFGLLPGSYIPVSLARTGTVRNSAR